MILEAHPGERVERVERLVEKQHLRLGHERSCKGGALRHAARELLWAARREAAEADDVERLRDEGAGAGRAPVGQAERDVVAERSAMGTGGAPGRRTPTAGSGPRTIRSPTWTEPS